MAGDALPAPLPVGDESFSSRAFGFFEGIAGLALQREREKADRKAEERMRQAELEQIQQTTTPRPLNNPSAVLEGFPQLVGDIRRAVPGWLIAVALLGGALIVLRS